MDIYHEIDKYEYVSFDVFDTLIKRNVPDNTDVFELVQKKYKKTTGICINDFKNKRILAEKVARNKSGGKEVSLQDIYEQLADSNLDRCQINDLINIEIEAEKMVCVDNRDVHQIFNYCLKNQKKILIITDIYLPFCVVENILGENGYFGYKKLYVSSSIKKRKRNGELFDHVLVDCAISGDELLHLGDNLKSDVISAKKFGIHSLLIGSNKNTYIRKLKTFFTASKSIDERTMDMFIKNHNTLSDSRYFQFGYEVFGRLLLGFALWLKDELIKNKVNNIYFFSRDGYILKQAFDIIDEGKTSSHYIYVSRRSLRLPYLFNGLDFDSVVDSLPRKSRITISEFFENLGLEVDLYAHVLDSLCIKKGDCWDRKKLKQNKVAIKVFEKIKTDVMAAAGKERQLMIEYFDQNGFHGKMAVVDIGWRGSLQFFVQEIFEHEQIPVEMIGYYVGLQADPRANCILSGYYNSYKGKKKLEDWSCYTGLIESLFVSDEGSVKNYHKDNNGNINPVLYDYEFDTDRKNSFDQRKCVQDIQSGGLAFVKDCKESKMTDFLDVDAKLAFSKLNEVGNHPTKAQVELFKDFVFYDVTIQPLIKNALIRSYLTNPMLFLKDFKESKWKIGYMKKTFGIPLPYYEMQKCLRR